RLLKRVAADKVKRAVESRENFVGRFFRVIHDRVGAKLSHQCLPLRRRGRRNQGAKLLCDLYCEGAHTAGTAGNEDALSVRDAQLVAQSLQRGEPGEGNGGGRREVE